MATKNRVTRTAKVVRITHEGAPAAAQTYVDELKRILYTAMLGEKTFYESGKSIENRLFELVGKIGDSDLLHTMAVISRTNLHLRHAPLYMAVSMAAYDKHRAKCGETLYDVISRADELGESLAMWDEIAPGKPIPAQIKKALRNAIHKFNEYKLAKYSSTKVKFSLRDVIRLTHPTPYSVDESLTFKSIVSDTIKRFDTWEDKLSAGEHSKTPEQKRQIFTELMSDGKLGGLAFLRNLRNMSDCNVSRDLIKGYFGRDELFTKVIPFRFLAANDAAPQWGEELNDRLISSVSKSDTRLGGRTAILVDGSGSMMGDPIKKAASIAAVGREMCSDADLYIFDTSARRISSAYRGIPLAAWLVKQAKGGGTMIGASVKQVESIGSYDRIIVITDDQSADTVKSTSGAIGYTINVAAYSNRVKYSGKWSHVDGFSEAVFSWIHALENDYLNPENGKVLIKTHKDLPTTSIDVDE